MALADQLRAAKALIDTPEKWIKGSYSNGCGGMCALGAVRQAVDYEWSDEFVAAERELLMAVPAEAAESILSRDSELRLVPAFNDDPSTTHADIMALFDRAIAAAEAAA